MLAQEQEEAPQDLAKQDGSGQDAAMTAIKQRIDGFRDTFKAKDVEEAKVPMRLGRPVVVRPS